MRVYVYPADVHGCGQYRLIMPARVLQAQGHAVTIEPPSDRQSISGMIDTTTGRLVDVSVPRDADVIVMQRLTFATMAHAVPLIRAKGVAVVVDMDDDLSCIHPRHAAYAKYQPENGGLHSWENAAAACRAATLVTTSTVGLQRVYASQGRGAVLHNCVPASYLDIPRVDSDVIGWGGSVHSHPDDLQVTGTAMRRLVSAGHQFRVVGPLYGVKGALDLDVLPDATGNLTFDQWPRALATLGVGMAPLEDSQFNISKSWLKCLEMSALGVPWVASPRDEYRRLHKLGAGLLADKPQHWYKRLRELATNAALRQEMSEAGRAVAAEHTIEKNAWRWLDIWRRAYELQHQAAIPGGAIGLVRA